MITSKKSFTLIEISIVLLVISLLSGLILSGVSLLQKAKTINIVKEITKYQEAIYTFYKTYESLPGDYGNAQYNFGPSGYTTKLWSEINTNDEKIKLIPHNGDQNGAVSNTIVQQDGVSYSETFGVWSHLSVSKLIEDSYSNICYNKTGTTVDSCAKSGYNLPMIKHGENDTSVYIFYKPDRSISNDLWLLKQISVNEDFNDHVLLLSDLSKHSVYLNTENIDNTRIFSGGGGINSELMFLIDKKIDDGSPLTGNVFGLNSANKDNQRNNAVKTGQCNTYTGNQFDDNLNRKEKIYTNNSNQSCLGVILFKGL